MKPWRRRLGCWLLAWVPAFGQAAAIELPDHRGATLVLPASPRRIVSLVPSFTEGVCALGGCDRLVGTDQFSNWPPRVAALPKLGGLEDTQVERIARLRPDLVLAAPFTRVTDRLERLGLKVLVVEFQTHDSVHRGLGTLAKMLARPDDNAGPLWDAVERDLQAAAQSVPPAWRGKRVYFEVSGSTHAAGPSSFIGETLSRLGLVNVVPRELGPFPKLNPEFVVRAQPDVLIVGDTTPQALAARPGWSQLRAVSSRRVCVFSPERYEVLVRPGPRMGEAAQAIAGCLAALTLADTPGP